LARKQSRKDKKKSLRVIGGTWRGRKISFADDEAIRPSPDRIRETLFNWLQNSIFDAKCLELYAGSGILSVEALSRGASHATIIDQTRATVDVIRQNLDSLDLEKSRFSCIQSDANVWLAAQTEPFNLIFLDPPFNSDELARILPIIQFNNLLTEEGFIYVESAEVLNPSMLPREWTIYRSKKAASVHYCLINNKALD
jgi:16S rRNA (guanine966-N2)-methyltransferase